MIDYTDFVVTGRDPSLRITQIIIVGANGVRPDGTNMKNKIILILILILIVGAGLAIALISVPALAQPYTIRYMAQADPFQPREETINIAVAGYNAKLEILRDTIEDEMFVSSADPKISELAVKLGAVYQTDEEENAAVITRDAEEYKVYFDKNKLELNGTPVNVPVKVMKHNGVVYIPFKFLFKLFGGQVVYDEPNKKYYCDPMITGMELVREKDMYLLKINASGPVNFNYFYLRTPERYAVDVQNAILATDVRELSNEDIGTIKCGQFNSKPNIARFVIPVDKDIEMQVQPRVNLNQVVLALVPPKVATKVLNFSQVKIKDIDVKQNDNGVVIKVQSDGPMQYQWHRIKIPDRRMFLDIPDAVLTDKAREFKIEDNDFIESVKVAQFQKEPKPITRIVLNFKKEAPCNISSGALNQLVIETKNAELHEDEIVYTGAGVTSFPAGKYIICIDPGHGGSDTGAINRSLGIYEKDLNLDIARRLSKILMDDGWTVLMTRESDQDVASPRAPAIEELQSRADVANGMKADIFLSIHCNAMYDSSWSGTSSHWYKKIDYELAETMQNAMLAKLGLKNRGIIRNRFYVLRVTKMPAVLMECAFVSNYKEASLLATEEFRQKIAEGLADGLKAYVVGRGE